MDNNIVNPVTLVRRRLGLTKAQMARMTECGYSMLSQAENGYDPVLAPSVARVLESLGLPADEARRMYIEWRAVRARELRAERAAEG